MILTLLFAEEGWFFLIILAVLCCFIMTNFKTFLKPCFIMFPSDRNHLGSLLKNKNTWEKVQASWITGKRQSANLLSSTQMILIINGESKENARMKSNILKYLTSKKKFHHICEAVGLKLIFLVHGFLFRRILKIL